MESIAKRVGAHSDAIQFRCNLCGLECEQRQAEIQRESAGCLGCGSTLRFRSIVAVLTERLLGKPAALSDLGVKYPLRGLGMSDAHCYAQPVAEKFNYTNTFFHAEPLFDITKPAPEYLKAYDFLITSDVFEHVAPPVQNAFDNLRKVLKPGGVVIFSVPYSLEAETREHFPDLHNYALRQTETGEWLLDNTTASGQQQVFDKLEFHGGPGSTLEMRLFSLQALREHFKRAGFVDFRVHDQACAEFGIAWQEPWGITLSAVAPKGWRRCLGWPLLFEIRQWLSN